MNKDNMLKDISNCNEQIHSNLDELQQLEEYLQQCGEKWSASYISEMEKISKRLKAVSKKLDFSNER